jgi:hypothetical protein
LQDSKLEAISTFKASSFLPASLRSFVYLPSVGASGGIVTAWSSFDFSLTHSEQGVFSLTTSFASTTSALTFYITNVYGPCNATQKPIFLAELASLAANTTGPWLVLGDFNLLRAPSDRSNGNFDAREADIFNSWINDAGLLEIPLIDRLFTWSNNQPHPILARLDRALVNTDWNSLLADSFLRSFTRATSDHVPLLLTASSLTPWPSIFRLNNHRLLDPAFRHLVTDNWTSVGRSRSSSSASRLSLCLKRVLLPLAFGLLGLDLLR